MIFIDANVFLRFFAPPDTPESVTMQTVARSLIEAAVRGEEDVTTSEVVLHEVAYILTAKKHYGLPVTDVIAYLASIIQMPGMKLARGEESIYLRALDILAANPRLEFSDSVIAARTERLGVPLATFDEALAKLPFISRWQPNKP
jgi:predicted nucleic acid-binding protein